MIAHFGTSFGSHTWGAVNPTLQIRHRYHRSSIMGGPIVAEIEIAGSQNALWELLTWLRRPVEIRNDHGQPVWWGLVNEVRIGFGGITVGVGLDNMANTVAVAYSDVEPDGTPVRGTTTWVSDSASVSRYGTKEILDTMGEAGLAAAEARRDALLANRAWPRGVPSAGQSAPQVATVLCIGWIETLRWIHFARAEGRTEEGTSGTEAHAIGWGLTSNQIGFADSGLHHLGAQLGALLAGDKVVISGSSSNNGTLTVNQAATNEQAAYTATTIAFDPSDDIIDSANGLGFVDNGYFIYVQGSTANSGYHLIDETGDAHIATVEALTGTISTEAEGPSITITQGNRVTVDEALTDEIPGATITLTMVGVQLAQSFVAASSYTVAQVAIPIGRIGSPSDNLYVDLMSDSSGPGSVLETITVTGTDLTADDRPWRWIPFGNTTALVDGTTYWLRIRRSGSADADDYYTLGLTDTSAGACKVWNGSSWVDHPRGLFLPFKVWGAEENTDQIQRIIEDGGQFITDTDLATTGIATHEWRDGDMTAYDELQKLMEQGTSAGERLIATVTPERIFRLIAEPVRHSNGDRLMVNGRLRNVAGGLRQRGLLPVGEWLMIDNLPGYITSNLDISPFFVDEAAWSADSPDIFELRPKDAYGDI